MSEDEGFGTPTPPEFVAVTPRGVVPEPPAAAPAADEQPELEPARAAEPEPVPAAEPGELTDRAQAVPQAEPVPPPAGEPDTDAPDTDAPDTDAAVPDAGASESQPGAGEPEPAPDEDLEVSVRVAAEGMAAALAGTAAPGAGAQRRQDRSLRPFALATAACVVVAIAAGALLGWTAHLNSNRRAVAAARVAALAAAKKDTVLLLTYSYRTIDQDALRAEAGMTRSFRANYAQTVANDVKPLALKNHASTQATVAAAGVENASATKVTVLVFADQVVQNTALSAVSRLDRSVIEVTMVKQGGHWLINDVQTF